MYTITTINPDNQKQIKSSKRIYLDHKTQSSVILPTNHPDTRGTTVQPAQSAIYFTSVPLSGQSNAHASKVLAIAQNAFDACLNGHVTETMDIDIKVREKDQAFVAVCSYNLPVDPDQSVVEQEKAIWYALKMEALKALLSDPEIGPYLPVSDQQVEQLASYVDMVRL